MRFCRTRFKFGMCLACDKPRVILELYHFNNMLVGGESAYVHTVFLKQVSVIVVYLVTGDGDARK